MNDERRQHDLTTALRELPPVRASAGFTESVMQGLERRSHAGGRLPRWAWASSLAFLLASALAAGWIVRGRSLAPPPPTPAETLRSEYLQLQRELDALRDVAVGPAPLVYLGGDESVDLVFDLEPLVDPRHGGVRPASLQAEPIPATTREQRSYTP